MTRKKFLQIKGSTTIYGFIEKISDDSATIVLILPTGDKINVAVTEEQVMSSKIYSNARIKGDAVWHGRELKLVSFKAKEIHEFENQTLKMILVF